MNKKFSIQQIKKISASIKKKYPATPIIYYTKNFQFHDNKIEQHINCLSLNSNVSLKEEATSRP